MARTILDLGNDRTGEQQRLPVSAAKSAPTFHLSVSVNNGEKVFNDPDVVTIKAGDEIRVSGDKPGISFGHDFRNTGTIKSKIEDGNLVLIWISDENSSRVNKTVPFIIYANLRNASANQDREFNVVVTPR